MANTPSPAPQSTPEEWALHLLVKDDKTHVGTRWEESGVHTSWVERTSEVNKCILRRALVRGDGKILTKPENHPIMCDVVKHYAQATASGMLLGVNARGMFRYGPAQQA